MALLILGFSDFLCLYFQWTVHASVCAKVKFSARRAVVGEVDDEIDQGLNLSAIRAAPLSPVQH